MAPAISWGSGQGRLEVSYLQTRNVFVASDQRVVETRHGPLYCADCGASLVRREIGGHERDACPKCGRVVYRNPLPAISVVVAQNGRVLLGRRSPESICPGLWCLPCGFVEYDEDFLTAAIREVREETGLSVAPSSIINVAHNFLTGGVQTLVPVLLAEVVGGVAGAGDDLTELRWFGPDDELPEMAFESDRYIVARYRAGRISGLPVDERYGVNR